MPREQLVGRVKTAVGYRLGLTASLAAQDRRQPWCCLQWWCLRCGVLVWWIFLVVGGGLPAFASWTSLSSSGAQIYRDHCARCHGRNGEGSGSVSGLRDTTLSRTDVISVVSDGIPETTMLGWKGRLSDLEIKSVVDFMFLIIRTSRAETDEAADSRVGSAIWKLKAWSISCS